MNIIPPVMTLLLLGHILGDFYFQSNKMAENKNEGIRWLFAHGIVYTLCMAVVLFAGIVRSDNLLLILVLTSLMHFIIDYFKRFLDFKRIFSIDQLAHILSLIVIWNIWGDGLILKDWTFFQISYLQNTVLLIILGILIILKPIGILVAQGDIWDFTQNKTPPNDAQQNAGRMIGYLERIIIFFLILNGEYSAIAFVMAAKTVARFPEIKEGSEGRSQAEYYLIGTLISITSVFVVTVLLGLV